MTSSSDNPETARRLPVTAASGQFQTPPQADDDDTSIGRAPPDGQCHSSTTRVAPSMTSSSLSSTAPYCRRCDVGRCTCGIVFYSSTKVTRPLQGTTGGGCSSSSSSNRDAMSSTPGSSRAAVGSPLSEYRSRYRHHQRRQQQQPQLPRHRSSSATGRPAYFSGCPEDGEVSAICGCCCLFSFSLVKAISYNYTLQVI